MKKQLTEKVIYTPNDDVKITVENKPTYDEDSGRNAYKRKVTITVELGWDKDKLIFTDSDSIAEFIGNIDLEDPQQELPL